MNIMLDSTALMPTRGHATDAGLDLLSPRDVVVIKRGDKITQLVVVKTETPNINIVDKLDETERGEGGFGSTGR